MSEGELRIIEELKKDNKNGLIKRFALEEAEVKEIFDYLSKNSIFLGVWENLEPKHKRIEKIWGEEYQGREEKEKDENYWRVLEDWFALDELKNYYFFVRRTEIDYYAYQKWQEKYGEGKVGAPADLMSKKPLGPIVNSGYGHMTCCLTVSATHLQRDAKNKELAEEVKRLAEDFETVDFEKEYIIYSHLFPEEARAAAGEKKEEKRKKTIEYLKKRSEEDGYEFREEWFGRRELEKKVTLRNVDYEIFIEEVEKKLRQEGIKIDWNEILDYTNKQALGWAEEHQGELIELRKKKLDLAWKFLENYNKLMREYLGGQA